MKDYKFSDNQAVLFTCSDSDTRVKDLPCIVHILPDDQYDRADGNMYLLESCYGDAYIAFEDELKED